MTATLTPDELLGIAHQRLQAGDRNAADNFACMVLERHPAHAAAWLLRAELAWLGGLTALAAERLTHIAPASLTADEQMRRGVLLQALGDTEAARQAYLLAVRQQPDHARAWANLGMLIHTQGDVAGARHAYQQALAQDDSLALIHNNLAVLCQQASQTELACQHYQRAVALLPAYAVAWKNYANLLQDLGRHHEAQAAYEQALQHQPGYVEALAGIINMQLHRMDWGGIAQLQPRLEATLQADPRAVLSPFIYMALRDDPAQQLAVARGWASQYQLPVLPRRLPQRSERIRLAYLGGDFFSHATSWLTAGLFARHDRRRFEVIAYDYGRDDHSPLRQRLMAGFDRFVAVGPESDTAIAERIRADGIDILIDLKGWTRHSRCHILAARPAPLQLHYLGYPGTLGASWCDYQIADKVVVPDGAEQHLQEALIRLPHCYQINDREREIGPSPSRQAAGLPEQGLVFCCFNQHYKLTPSVFDLWMQLLQAVPGSVLWLLDTHPDNRARLQARTSQQGVDPARLRFAPALPQAAHLARLTLADLALDTLPCNSHTTASDALWAGVPLLTCSGRGFASRVAASCLQAVDLPELITDTPSDYLALAIKLGRQPAALADLRQRLAANRLACPLFDTEASVKALERAYELAWARTLAGLPPASFDLPPD